MATDKQIAANQLNALKSTGPRMGEGKEASSRNALTHGLTARKAIVLEDENEAEFLTLRQSLRDHYSPSGPIEALFVDTLAAHFWRLQRVPKFEALLLQASRDMEGTLDDPGEALDPAVRQLQSLREFLLPKDVLGKISRHEAHLLREIHKILQALGPIRAKARPVAPASLTPSAPRPHPPQNDSYDRILESMSQPRGICP